MKKLVIFDLDGTLAASKSSLDSEMSALLHRQAFVMSKIGEQLFFKLWSIASGNHGNFDDTEKLTEPIRKTGARDSPPSAVSRDSSGGNRLPTRGP